MASGLPIDEQYDVRWGSDTANTPISGAASGVSSPLDTNDELDPNDLPPMGSEAAVQPSAKNQNQWKEWDDDDDDDGFYSR